uniref:Uncharacterized protein n=1 Tax=Meloidogyne enterolobii TaxID=390850 RepID=A0A6V7TTZ1_MELEN|nr:unnamed protein product [Meloidogyne enterolobii]
MNFQRITLNEGLSNETSQTSLLLLSYRFSIFVLFVISTTILPHILCPFLPGLLLSKCVCPFGY